MLGYEPVRFVDHAEVPRADVVVALAFSAQPSWRVRLFDGVLEDLAFGPAGPRTRSPLLSSAAPVLEGLVDVLGEHPRLRLTVSVTSAEGEDLEGRRAHAIDCAATLIDYLTDRGLDRRRFDAAPQAAALA